MGTATLDGKLMFPSEYLAAVELQGRDAPVTITNVELTDLRMVDQTTKEKPVIHFKETVKKLVLNKTNAGQIADLLGSEARKWQGRRITLYPTTCGCFGKTVDCIRVRPTLPKASQASAVMLPPAIAPEMMEKQTGDVAGESPFEDEAQDSEMNQATAADKRALRDAVRSYIARRNEPDALSADGLIGMVVRSELDGRERIDTLAELEQIKAVILAGDYDLISGQRIPDELG